MNDSATQQTEALCIVKATPCRFGHCLRAPSNFQYLLFEEGRRTHKRAHQLAFCWGCKPRRRQADATLLPGQNPIISLIIMLPSLLVGSSVCVHLPQPPHRRPTQETCSCLLVKHPASTSDEWKERQMPSTKTPDHLSRTDDEESNKQRCAAPLQPEPHRSQNRGALIRSKNESV
jgi:hypothetical protein